MEILALAGARQFMRYLRDVSRVLNEGASIRLIIPTFYDPRRKISEMVLRTLIKDFGSLVTHPIRIDTKLSEAPGAGETIFEYMPGRRAATDYARLSELVERMPPVAPGNHSQAGAGVEGGKGRWRERSPSPTRKVAWAKQQP
jgi:cellulose biosynthesis protein BcsQ